MNTLRQCSQHSPAFCPALCGRCGCGSALLVACDFPPLAVVTTCARATKALPRYSVAMRRLVERGLETKIDDGDRLVVMMLRDIQKALKIKDAEIDPDFVAEAIWGGHYWALDWQYTGLFHDHVDSREAVHDVVDILDMWSFLEEGYEALSASEKARVKKEADPYGAYVTFTGFDGNNETEYMSIARFLIEKMGRFTRFKGRDLNSHSPSVDLYGRMFRKSEPIRKTLIGRKLSVVEIIDILKP